MPCLSFQSGLLHPRKAQMLLKCWTCHLWPSMQGMTALAKMVMHPAFPLRLEQLHAQSAQQAFTEPLTACPQIPMTAKSDPARGEAWTAAKEIGTIACAGFASERLTTKFGSTAKVTAECNFKYYRISECGRVPHLLQVPGPSFLLLPQGACMGLLLQGNLSLGALPYQPFCL